jgi:hypothetical protein
MATPKPGEIRCPTCHRSTPPAGFCTQCGSAIPSDARIRPRGMDRDELQDRIRQRRSGGEPYRRGTSEEVYGYERFEPEPEDSQARRARQPGDRRQDVLVEGAAAASAAAGPEDPRVESLVPPIEPAWPDVTREADDWARPAAAAASAPPPPTTAPPPSDVPIEDLGHIDNFDDDAYADDAYPYAYDWEDTGERRSSGAGAFAILGFLALGVLALLGGAVLAGVFSGDPNTGAVDPTLTPSPTVSESLAPTPSPSVEPSGVASGAPSSSAAPSGAPVTFPDGFTADAEPCLPGTMRRNGTGCDSNGATNGGAVEIYVGFTNGNRSDVLGVELFGPDGTSISRGSIDLGDIGCGERCPGWSYFPFSGLGPGTYEVIVTRNGERADDISFEVS